MEIGIVENGLPQLEPWRAIATYKAASNAGEEQITVIS